MFVIERIRRNEAGHVVEVEGFARTINGDFGSQSFGCTVSDLVSRIKCGDPVTTAKGALVKVRRVANDFDTIEDLPDTKPGARLIDLPTF